MAGTLKGNANSDRGLPAFDTIAAAVSGDEEALSDVLRHYDRLITTLSSEAVFDPDGTQRTQINGELKAQIQNRLIEGITMRFDLHRDA